MASKIGKVTKGNYVLKYKGKDVVNAPSKLITEGLLYKRPHMVVKKKFSEAIISPPKNYNDTLLKLLASENIASRKPIFESYDKQVQGFVIVEAGEADASVIAPLIDENVDEKTKKTGVAIATACNPRYGLISAYQGALSAVVEAARNVAATGAYPQAITDCLNYGNPEKPEQLEELNEGIQGIRDACAGLKLKNHPKHPMPVISGNVSLYNESKNGHIAPTAVICCVGKIDDYNKAIKMQLKRAGNHLYLLGERKAELGGSEYYRLLGHLGAYLPLTDLKEVKKEIDFMNDAVTAGLIQSAHDISEGGIAVSIGEMCMGSRGDGSIGAEIMLDKIPANKIRAEHKLFSENGGFICEITPGNEKKVISIAKKHKLKIHSIGKKAQLMQ